MTTMIVLVLSLFEAHKDQGGDVGQIEAKARKWYAIVSNLVTTPARETA